MCFLTCCALGVSNAYALICCLNKRGLGDQYGVNELFKCQVKREWSIQCVSFLMSMCMYANVGGQRRESDYFCCCLLLLCACVATDARPLGGIWLSDGAIKRPIRCVCVCVWRATWLSLSMIWNLIQNKTLYIHHLWKTSSLYRTHACARAHTHTLLNLCNFGKQKCTDIIKSLHSPIKETVKVVLTKVVAILPLHKKKI